MLLNIALIASSTLSANLVVFATLYAFHACFTHFTNHVLVPNIISKAIGHIVGAASTILHTQLHIVPNAFSNAQASLLYTFKFANSSTTSYHHIVVCLTSSNASPTLFNTQSAQLNAAHTNSATDDITFHFFKASILSQKLLFIAALAILSSACRSNFTIQLARSFIPVSSNVL